MKHLNPGASGDPTLEYLSFQRIAGLGNPIIGSAVRESLRPELALLWDRFTARQTYPGSPHRDTKSIYLRGPAEWTFEGFQHSLTAVDYELEQTLMPATLQLALGILRLCRAVEIGRVVIAQLLPGGVITKHVDEGAYAEHYQRVHLVLACEDECDYFVCGGKTKMFRVGELWWFNHRLLHSAENVSTEVPRIHLIIDFRA